MINKRGSFIERAILKHEKIFGKNTCKGNNYQWR